VAGVTGLCAGLRPGVSLDVAQCRPGWDSLTGDLRRLLADTWQRVLDGDPDGPALHECAHILADEYRAGRSARYHAQMQAGRDELAAVREAS
jgi:hypothetical protein